MNNESIPLLIRGGRIVDPGQGIDQVGDLLISGGKIMGLEGKIPTAVVSAATQSLIIDAAGLVVSPGFVDLHCHLREPGFESKETIATGTRAAATGGFTTICCMANTNPPLDNRAIVDWVKQKARKEGVVDVLPIGCITKGRKGEEVCDLAELADAGAVAFSDDGDPVENSQVMRRALDTSRGLGLLIIDHCEDKTLSAGGVMNDGEMSHRFGVKGIPAAAEETMVARDIALAELTGARLHVAHVSTRGAVELIRQAKEKGIPVTAEVTPHHLTLTEESILASPKPSPLKGEGRERVNQSNLPVYDTNAKVSPPLRSLVDITYLIRGLKDGVIDAIATDHAPHTLADKNCELELAAFGISGFETAFGCLMNLVHRGEIGLTTLISKLTYEPAKVIGKHDELGTLKVGLPANITLFDADREWVVDSHNFVSKGKNSPFHGYRFKGKVMMTIVDGKIVHKGDLLKGRFDSPPCCSGSTPCYSERSERPKHLAQDKLHEESHG